MNGDSGINILPIGSGRIQEVPAESVPSLPPCPVEDGGAVAGLTSDGDDEGRHLLCDAFDRWIAAQSPVPAGAKWGIPFWLKPPGDTAEGTDER